MTTHGELDFSVPRWISVLDPRGDAKEVVGGANERLTSLEDKTVGIVIDGPWRSWYLFSEVLEQHLQSKHVTTKRLSVNRLDINVEGLELDSIHVDLDESAIDQFAAEVDAVVVGLGN